jgi:hypothetical protein
MNVRPTKRHGGEGVGCVDLEVRRFRERNQRVVKQRLGLVIAAPDE